MDQIDQSRSGVPTWLKITGIGCLVIFVLAVIGVYLLITNIKSLGTTFVATAVERQIDAANLPADQKATIKKHIRRVAEGFKRGDITNSQLGQIMEKIVEGPLIALGTVYFFEQKYIAPSNMTDKEKNAARLNLQRFARGIYEEKISPEVIEVVAAPISTTGPDRETRLMDNPTPEQLNEFLALVKKHADDAQIPDEPFEIDIAEEIGQAIDQVLGERATIPADANTD